MISILTLSHIIVAVLLIIGIIMQQSGDGIGALGGGDTAESVRSTRRGFDKFIFEFTIVVAGAFVVLSLVSVVL